MGFEWMFNQVKKRFRQLIILGKTLWATVPRRLKEGPKRAGWTWKFELLVEFMRIQLDRAVEIECSRDPTAARQYLDHTRVSFPGVDRHLTEIEEGPRPLQYINPPETKNVDVLYFHGGGYGVYPKTYRYVLTQLSQQIQTPMWIPDYRLAPEHPFPAALEDARRCYFWLIEHRNINTSNLVVMGDSAGGNLMLSLLISLRDKEEPMPASGVGISPWTDLLNRGESFQENKPFDYLNKEQADRMARNYAGQKSRTEPLISPVEADLKGLPPLYLQAGESECLHDMIERFVQKARESGVEVTFDTWEEMVHVFTLFHGLQPEVSQAQNRIADRVNPQE